MTLKLSYYLFLVCSNNHNSKHPIFHFSQSTQVIIWNNFDTNNYPKVFGDSSLFRSWSLVFRTVSFLSLSFLVEKRRPKISTISILKNFHPANVTILIILTWNMGQKCSAMARCFSLGWYLTPKSSYHPFLVCSNNHSSKNPIFHFSQTTHFLIWHNFDTKNYPKVFGDGSLFQTWFVLDAQVVILPLPIL